MFFLTKMHNRKDPHKKIFEIEGQIFYLGDSSITKYILKDTRIHYNNTKWFFTIIEDGCIYSQYIFILTWDSIVVLDKHLNVVYKYKLEDRYTKISNYDYLIILYNLDGKILILHILDQKKLIFNYPLQYDYGNLILDIEFINNNVYVLGMDTITTLEYSGQFIEYMTSQSHKGGYRLEQEEDVLYLITKEGVIDFPKGNFQTIFKNMIVCTKKVKDKLVLLDETGVLYDLKGEIHSKINTSKDFIFIGELILSIGCSGDNYVMNNNEVCSIEGCRVYSEGRISKDMILVSDGENTMKMKLITKPRAVADDNIINDIIKDDINDSHKDSIKDDEIKITTNNDSTATNRYNSFLSHRDILPKTYKSKRYTFHLSPNKVTVECKKTIIEKYNLEYYDHEFTGECLILINREEVIFITGLGKFPIKTSSRKVVFTPSWVICFIDKTVKFVNIKERRLEYFQLLKFEVKRIWVYGSILIYSGANDCYFSTLIEGPTPPVVIKEKVVLVENGFIVTTQRVIDIEENKSFEDLSMDILSIRKTVRGDKKYLVINDSKVFEVSCREILEPYEVQEMFSRVRFTKTSALVYEGDTLVYEYPLGEFYCTEVKELVYVGFSDCVIVYKVGKKSLLRKVRIPLESRPLVIKEYGDRVYISVLYNGLMVYKDKELVARDDLSRSIEDILVVGDRVYGSSSTGYLYIYSTSLEPLGTMFVGKILSMYFNESLFFLTRYGEIGELIEIKEDLSRIDGRGYFEMYTRKRMTDISFLREVCREKELPLRPIEISKVHKKMYIP